MPSVRIELGDHLLGRGHGKVFIDEREVRDVRSVGFDASASGLNVVRLEVLAEELTLATDDATVERTVIDPTVTTLRAEVARLKRGLRYYANGCHFEKDDVGWDTVSGEPTNFWCDDAGSATVEDGTIAKLFLHGGDFDPTDDEKMIPPTRRS